MNQTPSSNPNHNPEQPVYPNPNPEPKPYEPTSTPPPQPTYSPPPMAYTPPPAPNPYVSPPPRRRPPKRSSPLRTGCLGCLLGFVFFCVGMLVLSGVGVGWYAANPPETRNILILGMDARPGTGQDQIARTDSIMILSINPRKQSVALLSLPRDVFIDSPAHGRLRANTIVREAELQQTGNGIPAMIAAMENTFKIDIQHHARLSFEGFVDIVDAVGGVTIDVPRHIVDNAYPTDDNGTMRIEFQAGRQHMDGATALIYSRTRHADDDYQRAARQQQVIEAVMGKLTNPLNLYRWPSVWRALTRNIETDLTAFDLIGNAPGLLLYGRSSSQIERLVIDRDYLTRGGNDEVIPNQNAIEPWLEAHLR